MMLSAATVKADTSPVAYWTLDETSGIRYDSAGLNHLSVTGTITATTGQAGNAAVFPNTAGSYLSITDNATLSTGGETSFSLSLWVKLNNKSNTQVFVGKYGGGSGEYALYYEHAFRRFVFSTYSAPSANNYVLADGIGEPATDTWYHVTAIHDAAANTNSITVNGVTNTISGVPEHVDTSANFYVGAFNGAGQYPAQATIDELRFYKTALTPQEIEAISEPPSNLLAHWKFDEGSGATAADASGNGYTGTISNASFSPVVPTVAFTNPYSMYFNPAQSGRIVTTGLQLNGLTEFTVAGWAYPTAATNRASWFGQNDMVEFGFTDGNTLFCYTSKGEVSWDFNPSTFLNNWHNITCLGSASSLTIYIDGVNVASTSVTAGSYGSSSDYFTIGAGAVDGGTDGPFSGYIDDVRVYNRALTPEEMSGLGTGQAGPGGPDVPTINITTPAQGVAYRTWSPVIDWGDADECAYSWDNTAWLTVDCQDGGSVLPEPAEANDVTLFLRANYTASTDYGIASRTFDYDTTSPTVSAGDDALVKSSFVQSTATASDGGTGVASYLWTKQSGPGTVSFSNSSILQPTINSISVDGTYILRLTVTDGAGNSSHDDITVVWDTTPPSVPGQPSVGGSHSRDNTPYWQWTASTDTVSGLAYIAYAVQWSQDTSFSGLGGQAGTTENSYEIPDGFNMTDSTWYFRAKAIDVLGNESAWSDYGTVQIDTSIPTLSNVQSTQTLDGTSQTITWDTNEATSSIVSYGPTVGRGVATAETDTTPRVTSHSVILSDLLPCAVYYVTVTSNDAAGNSVTSDPQHFTTGGCAGASVISQYVTQAVSRDEGQVITFHQAVVTVPAGFAPTDATFQVKRISYDLLVGTIGMPSGVSPANSVVYDIKALQDTMSEISTFDQPITITLSYDPSDITLLLESSLVIYRWDDGIGWNKLSDCRVDTSAHTVTCTTFHFSTFAVFGQKRVATVSQKAALSSPATIADESLTQESVENGPIKVSDTKSNPSKDQEATTRAGSSETFSGVIWGIVGAFVFGAFIWFIIARRRKRRPQDESSHVRSV